MATELLTSADYTRLIDDLDSSINGAWKSHATWETKKQQAIAARDACGRMPGRVGGSSRNSRAKTACVDAANVNLRAAQERIDYYNTAIINAKAKSANYVELRKQALAEEQEARDLAAENARLAAQTSAQVSKTLATHGLTKDAVLSRETLIGEGRKTATINTAKATEKQNQNLVQAKADSITQATQNSANMSESKKYLLIGIGIVVILAAGLLVWKRYKS